MKGLSSSALDMELRMLLILEDNDDEEEAGKRPELHFLELLMDYFIEEVSCRNNFEFVQALLRLFLKVSIVVFIVLVYFLFWCILVPPTNPFHFPFICCNQIHGETIRCQPVLQEKAQKLMEVQSAIWQKVDNLFQSTRCMVSFLSNSQF